MASPSITKSYSGSASDTMRLMCRMVGKYRNDVIAYLHLTPLEFFHVVASLPWMPDNWNGKLAEVLKRPYYTLNTMWAGGDCDDKAIAMASYFALKGIPWRFVCVGNKAGAPPSHVFTEADFGDGWTPMDATYPDNQPGIRMRPAYPVVVTL